MLSWPEDTLVPLGIGVGLFLIAAAFGNLLTQPWQYYNSTAVTIIRIIGTIGMLAIGIGLIYIAWGHQWLAARTG